MRHQRECLIAFLCLGITLASSASRREELERAAELAVEKAAERAAERAVEKALDGGNSTTESKIVSESYTHVKKNPNKEKKEDDFSDGPGYEPIDDDMESEEDVDDWSGYSQQSAFAPPYVSDLDFHTWSKKIHLGDLSSTWRRFPRSELPREQANWAKPREKKVVTVEKKVPMSVPVEKKIPVYKHVPYDVKVPVPQPYTVEKRVPYPVKVYVNVPVDVPESTDQVERQVPYAVNFDNLVPYKVEVPIQQPMPYEIKVPKLYEVEKKLPVKVVDRPYPVEVARPYSVEVSKPYPVRIKVPVEKPYLVPVERPAPMPVKVPDPQSYLAEKPVPVEVMKPYSVPIKVPVNKPYEVHETKPVLVSVRKPFPYFAQVPVKLGWRTRNRINGKEDQLGSESAQFLRPPWPARDSYNR